MRGEWRSVRLGDVVTLQRGFDLPMQQRKPGIVPIVSSSGVSDFHSEVAVKGPGVVTGRYGTIGQVFFIKEDFWPLNTTLWVKDFQGNDPSFTSYLLRTVDFHSCSDKSSVPGVNRNDLHKLSVLLPPLPEQKRIAEVLGALDDKIELNRRMNRTLEELAQSLFKSWFVDFDGQDDLVESEIGLVPRGWEVRPIGDTVKVVGGGTPSTKEECFWENGSITWVTPKDLSGLDVPVLLGSERSITEAGLKQISSGLLPVGTFLLSSRAPIGYVAIAQVPIAINQGFMAIPPGVIPATFLLFWVKQNMELIKARAGGSTFAEISKSAFRPMLMVIPPENLLSEFSKRVDPLFEKITNNTRESCTLTQLRDTLLPKLISGEIRVSEAEKHIEPLL